MTSVCENAHIFLLTMGGNAHAHLGVRRIYDGCGRGALISHLCSYSSEVAPTHQPLRSSAGWAFAVHPITVWCVD